MKCVVQLYDIKFCKISDAHAIIIFSVNFGPTSEILELVFFPDNFQLHICTISRSLFQFAFLVKSTYLRIESGQELGLQKC